MILALAGNPNCGKTTLFNALTGANARTGNFPGVTVTRSEGVCRARPEITLVDLPGVYALRPYSDEERVTRSYLLGGAADAVISIADATCPARSLYLTLQLLELGVPVVLALNVMDALRAGGGVAVCAEFFCQQQHKKADGQRDQRHHPGALSRLADKRDRV